MYMFLFYWYISQRNVIYTLMWALTNFVNYTDRVNNIKLFKTGTCVHQKMTPYVLSSDLH